jgi:uncharacterized protein DUF4154
MKDLLRLANLLCASTGRRSSRRRRGLWRLLRRLTAASLVLACVSFDREVFGQDKATGEYQIKAAFLFHFAQFVEWPPEAFKNAAAPLTYCTVGEDPFNGALEGALSGKNIGTHPIRVEHVKQGQELRSCQILFIGIAEKKRLAATLESVKSRPVLTVGDSEHFAQQGGIIGFCEEENKIRFEINLGAATSVKLRISAKLLSLAKTVLGHSEGAA